MSGDRPWHSSRHWRCARSPNRMPSLLSLTSPATTNRHRMCMTGTLAITTWLMCTLLQIYTGHGYPAAESQEKADGEMKKKKKKMASNAFHFLAVCKSISLSIHIILCWWEEEEKKQKIIVIISFLLTNVLRTVTHLHQNTEHCCNFKTCLSHSVLLLTVQVEILWKHMCKTMRKVRGRKFWSSSLPCFFRCNSFCGYTRHVYSFFCVCIYNKCL